MKISTADRVFAAQSATAETGDLVAWLKQNATSLPKDRAPLWSPTTFANASRREADALEVCALVFDFDEGRDTLPLLAKVGVCHAWHTSASHTLTKQKWRLVIPLDRPVPRDSWEKFWTNAAALLGLTKHDKACGNVGRFYYVPPVSALWETHEGRPLPVDEVLIRFVAPTQGDDLLEVRQFLLKARNQDYVEAIRKGLAGEPCFAPGNRDNGVTGLGFYLGRSVCSDSVAKDSVYRVLERGLALPGPEPKAHWEKKFKEAFERGRKVRLEKSEEARKALNLNEPWAKALQTVARLDGSVSIISNTYNASVILARSGDYCFRKNLLEDTIEFSEHDSEYRAMTDADTTNIANWLQKQYRINVSRQQVYDQCDAVATVYDPLKTYIEGLHWDGTPRIDDFLVKLFGCEDTPQARMYSRKWLIGLVARALKPGCKMDTVLVLQGAQGLGKSTALRLLTEPWFSDSRMFIGDKDSLLAASRFWCHEFAELASLKRADLETMKAFFTSPVDSFRPPYGRATVQKPRRCVYVATTNEGEFLTDPSGARRFWVVSVKRPINFKEIQSTREQLIAEAAHYFLKGEVWWLETPEERKLQSESALDYQLDDNTAVKDAIIKWWGSRPFEARPEHLTAGDVLTEIWNVPLERVTRYMEMSASRCLRDLGFIRARLNKAGMRCWAYRPSAEFEKMPYRRGNEVKDLKVETGGKNGLEKDS